jgi:RNA polymerase sigma factor (sigma-70 family)
LALKTAKIICRISDLVGDILLKMTSDLDLLRQFARENSQDAFTALVDRHVNLVYSAALRQVRSPQLAEEIAQSVFADLARDAGKLKADTILPAWLYSVTRRTAIDAIRKESRRQLREQIAVEMNDMNSTANEWKQIEPLLDDAMAALDETDRAAILLRYFENKSLREVGEALGASDDAAQKRVSRAVEKLREFFSKQKITVGASGLAVLISANAVQSAPAGLAATISAAAVLAGTAVHTSTVIAATKTIAMTTLQKTFIAAALTAAIGTGTFEAHQNSQLREQIQTLQQQQTPLAEQIRQLQQERDDATNRLANLLAENLHLKSNPNETELLKLRGEVTQLKTAKTQRENDPTDAAARALMDKENQIKQYVEQHPNEKIPEFQYISDQSWLTIAEAKFETTNDYENAMRFLRFQAEDGFGAIVGNALMKYSDANNRQFPTDLSQLQPYLDPAAEDMLTQLYTIAPASIVKDPPPKFVNGVRMSEAKPMIGNWIITRKIPTDTNSPSRFAIYDGGATWWQSSPSSDNQ